LIVPGRKRTMNDFFFIFRPRTVNGKFWPFSCIFFFSSKFPKFQISKILKTKDFKKKLKLKVLKCKTTTPGLSCVWEGEEETQDTEQREARDREMVELVVREVLSPLQVHYTYCTLLYCNVSYCTVQYCIVLYCTVLYCTVLYSTVKYRTVPISLITHSIFLIYQSVDCF